MRTSIMVCVCLSALCGPASAQGTAVGVARYAVVAVIDHPDSFGVSAMHLNERGQVAGRFFTAAGCDAPEVSFVWTDGVLQLFTLEGAYSTMAESVNDRGFVTGGYRVEPRPRDPDTGSCLFGPRQGFVISPEGEVSNLPWSTYHSVVNVMSPSGWIVGPMMESECDSGSEPGCVQSFLYDGSELIRIQVGESPATDATDISSRGEVVGSFFHDANWMRGYRFRGGAYQLIDIPNALHTVPTGINTAGDVVGAVSLPGKGWVPFLLKGGRYALIELVGVVGLTKPTVWDVNDAGKISGWFTGADGRRLGFVARPVPR